MVVTDMPNVLLTYLLKHRRWL